MPPHPAGVTVRDAHADDREAVRALTLRAYGEYASVMSPVASRTLDEALREALASDAPAHRIVAERDGVIVGSVMLYPPAVAAYGALTGPARWPELRLLAVSPDVRGLGIGELLVTECIRRAIADGASEIGLHTATSMHGAARLYERMGFVRSPEHDFEPAGGEVVRGYRLPLSP